MRFLKKTMLVAYALTALSLSANAQSNVLPVYMPGGTIPNLSIYDLLSPLPQLQQNGWWYFVGLVHDQNDSDHSLQVTLIRSDIGKMALGLGGIGFTFKNTSGKTVYLWNAYPTSTVLKYIPIAQLQSQPAINNNFYVGIQSNPGNQDSAFLYNFAHDINDTQHWVGQIGAKYTLSADGVGEIGAAENNLQLVSYQLNITLKDERGVVPEGMDGYVGSDPATPNSLNSWEYAAPHLRILQWKITVKPVGPVTSTSLLTQPMTFQNNNMDDQLWLDRQILHIDGVDTQQPYSSPWDTLAAAKTNGELSTLNSKPMYFGTWMSFCFNHTSLKNTCGDAVAIWQPNTPTNEMNSDTNATAGFINLFTPDSNGRGFPQQVGSAQTEALSIHGDQKDLPFQVENDPNTTFTSPISHHTYAKVIYVTIRKNTAFSALLHQQLNSITDNSNLELKFVALSKQSENIPGDYTAGFYEGAAKVYLCSNAGETCTPAGTGFLEQSGYQ